jgi:hypothetical protein
MLRLQTLIVLIGLSLAAALPPSIASAATAGHLYAATYTGATNADLIYRFPLKNGIPTTKADLTIPGTWGAVAVSRDGTLYATGGARSLQIFAFPYGSTKAQRTITIPPMYQCTTNGLPISIGAIAADVHGDLFVALNGVGPGSARVTTATRRVANDWSLCEGVAIFGPEQRGGERPEHEIALTAGEYVLAVAIDDTENLYASLVAAAVVQEYANAFSHPQLTRVFPWQPSSAFIDGLSTDALGNVYLLNADNEVQVFPPSGMQMRNDMTFQSPHDRVSSIAATSQYVYAANYWTTSSVDIYSAVAVGGQTKPLFSVPLPGLASVAVGP